VYDERTARPRAAAWGCNARRRRIGIRVECLGFRVQGSGFRVWGKGFRAVGGGAGLQRSAAAPWAPSPPPWRTPTHDHTRRRRLLLVRGLGRLP